MKSAAKNLKELSDSSQLKPPATAGSTPTALEPVHQVSANTSAKSQQCYHCGKKGHYAPACKYKDTICNKCGKVGHLQKVCCSKRTRPTQSTRPVNDIQDDETDEYQLLNITSSGKVPPWNVCGDIEGVTVSMQLDTGASLSLMAETTFREH